MKPDPRFTELPKSFWAYVRLIGQECGYTERGTGRILVPSRTKVEHRIERIDISPSSLDTILPDGVLVWDKLLDYFEYRAAVLHNHFEPSLMNAETAEKEFDVLKKKLNPKCPLPMNKQKGKKRSPAYLPA